ncbi:MAG: GNAT family N-acetyltransferase [Planctomycetaceae bacterium]|nr:GNAT family N-acetyltransferase [Planctomycetaceae bacterium]
MKFSAWSPSLLPATVAFWNRSFASRRNFFPVSEALFRERVTRRETPTERFDPTRFIVARDGKEIAGFIHVGERPESLCRTLDPEWRSGTQGYVAFLYVDPSRRRKGLGTELWHRGLERLKSTRQVVLDGQCFNPYYGNSEGPFTPFWGTPEGVSVDWNDSATKKFLARKGFAPRFKGVQLSLDLTQAGNTLDAVSQALIRQGMSLEVLKGAYPELGKAQGVRRPMPEGLDFEVVAAVRRGKVAGLIACYPMREVRPGLFGIYEAVVVPEWRGKSLGKRLLEAARARMKALGGSSCEVLTLPELSPAAHKLYFTAGFQPVQNWAIY